MKKVTCFATILVLLAISAKAVAKENPKNIPDSTEAKAVIDSMLFVLENWDEKKFGEFLLDTGMIRLGMNGGMLAFYVDKPGLIVQINHGMSILCHPDKIADLKHKLQTRNLRWYIDSSYITCEVSGNRDWLLSFFKDNGRYYLIEILDPNCGPRRTSPAKTKRLKK
ncbi:MAG: hypothetical protein G01um101420_275 [Parcubacteria group bacterium Gr01-1014_20]|nr:MAG: hypothetical protein G01um101420_275 [Parcubacteria group bacterium Gr01-1014_20]